MKNQVELLLEKIITQSELLNKVSVAIKNGDAKIIPGTDRYLIHKDSSVLNIKTLRYLKPCINQDYRFIHIRVYGKSQMRAIHRLLMLTFVGESNLAVNHKDGNKLNNSLSNLEYCTTSENTKHAWRTGLIPDNGRPVVNLQTGEVYKSVAELSRVLGVKVTTLSNRLRGFNNAYRKNSKLRDISMYAFQDTLAA